MAVLLRRFVGLSLLLTPCLALGCGSAGPKRYAVNGVVKYQGRPIPNGTITFTPEDPTIASAGGAAIVNGAYEIPAAVGLHAGRYRVAVNYPDPKRSAPEPKEGEPPGEGREVRDLLPPKYNTETQLSADVADGGKNEFVFDLK